MARQSTHRNQVARLIHGRQCIPRGKRYDPLIGEKSTGCTSSALARMRCSVSNATSISGSLLACTISIFSPSFSAASSTSRTFHSLIGLRGLTRKPINVAAGTESRKSPTCLAAIPPNSEVTPVALPPGRFKLATRLLATGSSPVKKTTGILPAARFAACLEPDRIGRIDEHGDPRG
jgi:hypothetical protein